MGSIIYVTATRNAQLWMLIGIGTRVALFERHSNGIRTATTGEMRGQSLRSYTYHHLRTKAWVAVRGSHFEARRPRIRGRSSGLINKAACLVQTNRAAAVYHIRRGSERYCSDRHKCGQTLALLVLRMPLLPAS